MEKKIITFSANEQQLIKTGGINCYASNIVAYIEAQFDLGANWHGFDSVRAVWYTGYVKGISTVLDSNGKCIVPYEVLTHKGDVMVNLVGSISDGETLTDRLTTCPVTAVAIKCNARIDADNSKSITPSEYEQFVATVKADADRAEAGADEAEQSAQSAGESATASANSASDSAQSATASAQSAQNASESAISAETAKDDAEDARDKILGMRATAETLEAGSDATASYDNGLLTLGIPRGDKGEQGIQGETGATPNFSIGEVDTLEPNESATATITGTAENPVLNLGIPKGEQGDVSQAQLDAAVSDLKSDLSELSNIVIGENLFTQIYPTNFNNNNAITYNGDGSYTVGNTDYGVTTFGQPVTVPAGLYCLYGVEAGYSYLSTTNTTSGEFKKNQTANPLWFYLDSETTCYIGYRAISAPANSFVITPYLRAVGLQKEVSDLETVSNALPSDYFANNNAKATAITSGDLNDYTTVGNFKITASSIASAVSNTPVNEAGRIVVLSTVNNNNQIQYYITNNGTIYYRTHNANGWTAWAYIANSDHVNALAPKASPNFTGVPTAPTAPNGTSSTQIATTQFVASAVNALGVPIATNASAVTQISANSDLNDYLAVGNYRIGTSATASTVAHIPFNDAGRLIVMGVGHPNTTMQVYIANTRHIFMRTHNASGWSVWQELVLNTDEYKALYTDVDRINVASQGLYSFIKVLESMGIYNVRFANAPVPINLQNYVTGYAGNTQNVHPKVLYFASKFGGHYYWMAYTPYPYGKSQYENPCIAYSDDGYSWTNIEGNPIDDPQGNGYNSDTHLVYRSDTNTLECWYRYVSDSNPRYETIYRQTSTDGVTWSAKETVFQSTTSGATHYLSPAVEWDGSKYRIWVVDGTEIVYYEAVPSNITAWTRIRSYSIPFTDDGQSANPWHLDVIRDGNTYIMLVICMVSNSPRDKWSLFITTSSDNITYTTPTKVVEGASDSWDVYMYRSSIVKVGNTYRIYYSAMDADTVCGIGIAESESLSNFIGKLIL